MLKGDKEGFEIIYTGAGEPILDDDEKVIAEAPKIFPKIYRGWDYFGVHVEFVPLSQGRMILTTERLIYIATPEVLTDYRDFFSVPLDEIYGVDFKKKTVKNAQDVNIYVRTVEGHDYTISFVIPLFSDKEKEFSDLLAELKVDSLEKLKRNPKYFRNKIDFVRRNKWIKYMFEDDVGPDEGIQAPCIVEDVYLINKEGVLIAHETWKEEGYMDADIFSGMVLTVESFLRDSFAEDKGLELKMIDLKEFKIYIESGTYLIMMIVYTGVMPESLMVKAREALDEIETINSSVFENWDGEVSKVVGVTDILNRLFE